MSQMEQSQGQVLHHQLGSQLLELQSRLLSELDLMKGYQSRLPKDSDSEWVDWKVEKLELGLEKVQDSLSRLKFLEAEARSLESVLLSD